MHMLIEFEIIIVDSRDVCQRIELHKTFTVAYAWVLSLTEGWSAY